MRYIRKTIFVAVMAAAALVLAAMAGVTPSAAQPTPTPTVTATAPPATPTATPVLPTATPTATVVAPTPTPTATVVTDPHISFNPALLSFTAKVGGAQSEERALYIWNSGAGEMAWELTEAVPWLGTFPDIGVSTGEVDTVAVWVDPEGLSKGMYTGNIVIYSDDADNSPQVVLVSLTVSEQVVVATATPTATPTASPETQPTPTMTPTPTPTPVAGGGLPMWVWPVVGVLAVLALAFGVLLLHPARLWGRLRGLFARGGEQAEGLTDEETYEDTYGDDGGEPPEDYD